MIRIILISALVHLGVLVFIFWWIKVPPSVTPRKPIELEVLLSKKGEKKPESFGFQKPTIKNVPNLAKKAPSIQDLGLNPMTPPGAAEGKPSTDGKYSRSKSSDGFEAANSIDLKQDSNLYPFFKALWKKVDASVIYPSDFVKERITGLVDIQLVVDRTGRFKGRFINIESNNSLLKAYVLVVLMHALKEGLPKHLWANREDIIVVTRFEFNVFSVGESPQSDHPHHFKNMLYFSRFSYVDPKLKEQIETIFTRYFPPIIPIPGGFVIDFIRAYQMIKNYEKTSPSELREIRIENTKTQLDSLVHESSP
jgi:hypothetical protein